MQEKLEKVRWGHTEKSPDKLSNLQRFYQIAIMRSLTLNDKPKYAGNRYYPWQ